MTATDAELDSSAHCDGRVTVVVVMLVIALYRHHR